MVEEQWLESYAPRMKLHTAHNITSNHITFITTHQLLLSPVKINISGQLQFLCVHEEYGVASVSVRKWTLHYTVKPTWSQQGRVKQLESISGTHDDNSIVRGVKTVHAGQYLVQRIFLFAIHGSHTTRSNYSMRSNIKEIHSVTVRIRKHIVQYIWRIVGLAKQVTSYLPMESISSMNTMQGAIEREREIEGGKEREWVSERERKRERKYEESVRELDSSCTSGTLQFDWVPQILSN